MCDAAQPSGASIPSEIPATVQPLAFAPNILACFVRDLERSGVVGEARLGKLLYLAVTSRFLDRPVSVAVKGHSSGGKSFTTEQVLKFFPESAYYTFTAMSEKVLVYTDADFRHRVIVVFEAAGLGDFATYLIRSLLSEGRIHYEVTEKTPDGFKPRRIEKPGPTGLLITTTKLKLHPENETRLLSIDVSDSPEQTRAVFHALAEERPNDVVDYANWIVFQQWLATAEHRVSIPYAESLAGLIPPAAIRLRRDLGAVLALIKAHAILHQASRKRDQQGRIIATMQDYAAVRELVADLLAEGAGAAVSGTVRETVNAVKALLGEREVTESINCLHVAQYLYLDESAASRRVNAALRAGYLRNDETRRGQPLRLVLGDPMPDEQEILPTVERLHGCTQNGEVYAHSPEATPSRDWDDAYEDDLGMLVE